MLGPFELLEPLAEGGSGEVWRARHRPSRLSVAVKVLTAERARDDSFVQAFHDEARAMAALRHPNVIRVLDYGVLPEDLGETDLAPGSPYLVMELAAGTLTRWRPESFSEVRARL